MDNLRDTPLQEALRLINADRNRDYGEPYENFRDIAEMLTVMLKPILKDGTKIQCYHVSMMMIAVKLSRMTTSPTKLDSWVDIAGYIGAGWEATVMEQEHDAKERSRSKP